MDADESEMGRGSERCAKIAWSIHAVIEPHPLGANEIDNGIRPDYSQRIRFR